MMSITKSVDFQGKIDEFSNVYRFKGAIGTESGVGPLVDAMVDIERPIFSNQVAFKRARVWEDNALAPNTMLLTKDLLGQGGASSSAMYKELAIMLRYPLPFRIAVTTDTTNVVKRVSRYLRKYLHTDQLHGYPATGSGAAVVPLAAGSLTVYSQKILEPIPGVLLCAPNGDVPTGPAKFSGWLEHRQFPRGRKES